MKTPFKPNLMMRMVKSGIWHEFRQEKEDSAMSGTDVISSPQAGAQQLIFTDEVQALLEPRSHAFEETRAASARIRRLFSVGAFITKKVFFWLNRIALVVGTISLFMLFVAAMTTTPRTNPGAWMTGCTIHASGSFW
jgi:hypothetical protein